MRDLRHDWTLPEIESIYTTALPDLVFRAQTVHRANHRADEVQGCTLGMLTQPQADSLADAGLTACNHNLDRLGMRLSTAEA